MTPPVAPTPQPPSNPPDRHDTAEVPVTKGEMKKAFKVNEIWTVLVAAATAGAALLGAYTLFIDKAEAAGRKEAAEAVKEAREAKEIAKAALAQGDEIQKDTRALYRATLYRERQERLEQPPPVRDGGL